MTVVVNPSDARTQTTLPVLAGLLLALACAGCGGSGGSPQDQAPRGASSQPGRPTSGVPSEDTGRKPGFPEAADGTNVRACHDGSCEILATKRVRIPLDPRFDFKTFSFDPADSTWRYTYSNGGSGKLSFLAPPYSGSWAGPNAKQGLVLTVVASDGSKAVISLRPGK
jgi:hypothetical protein